MPLPIRPNTKHSVRELLIEAGHDVSAWEVRRDGTKLANPNINSSRNSAWSFPGKPGEPLVACIWVNGLQLTEQGAFYEGNMQAEQQRLLDRDEGELHNHVRSRLREWTRSLRDLGFAIRAAFKHSQPVRLILLDGQKREKEQVGRSSEVRARTLDTATWWVHSYDFDTGAFRIVRGIDPPCSD